MKTAKMRLKKIASNIKFPKAGRAFRCKTWKAQVKIKASRMLEGGTATAMINICLLLRIASFTGTCFAQPKCAISGIIIVPNRLICAMGFRFNLPFLLAVL